jgi:circadian clock protein KaiC
MSDVRIPTGVQGLDEIMNGGFLPASSYLIAGGPGTGKTVLGCQFLHENALHKARCLYVTLSEPADAIRRNASSFGWDSPEIVFADLGRTLTHGTPEGEYSVFSPQEVESEPVWQALHRAVEDHHPDRMVIDSATCLLYLSADPYQFRKQMQKLLQRLSEKGCVSLWLFEAGELQKDMSVALATDGILLLTNEPSPSRVVEHRTIEVTKFRGSSFLSGRHPMRITSRGIVVWPHWIETLKKVPYERDILSSGVPSLDELLGGGLPAGGCTILSGPSGVGKTTLAMQFLVTAASQGKKSIFYTFEEAPASILGRCREVGIRAEDRIEDGTLEVREINPLIQYPDEFLEAVRQDTEKRGAQVFALDSLKGYQLAMAEFGAVNAHVQNLVHYLRRRRASLFLVVEQERITGDIQISEVGVSYISDNVLCIRYAESSGEIIKVIHCLKKRLGAFQPQLRELVITREGIRVGEKLDRLRGVLTGTPEILDRPKAPES